MPTAEDASVYLQGVYSLLGRENVVQFKVANYTMVPGIQSTPGVQKRIYIIIRGVNLLKREER